MTWKPLKIKNIAFLGPKKPSASLEFGNGVNVICGASDTGKSFIVEALDFLLGGSTPLRDIPERVGYDRIRIIIEAFNKGLFTIERSVEGGEFRCFNDWIKEIDPTEKGNVLHSKHAHNREDNLSGWLLSNIGLIGRRIRRNKQGETQSLSFRDLAKLIIIQENNIIKQESPFLTGQYATKTSEYATLKMLLTGIDDSALVPDNKLVLAQQNASSKIELIDQWLEDLRAKIDEIGIDRQEIETQLNRLNESVELQRNTLQKNQQRLDDSMIKRREILKEKEAISWRIDEINDLLARFNLLMQHYSIDLDRLIAVQESGSLFVHQERVPCPLCGADPDNQHIDENCGGNVETVIEAAGVEIEKIKKLSTELQQTIIDLQTESVVLTKQLSDVEKQYQVIDNQIREIISPDVSVIRASFSEIIEKREEVKRVIDLFAQIDNLERQKSNILLEINTNESSEPSHTDLSKTVLDGLSQQVEKILKAWNFPGYNRVYFDENKIDFVIDGKPRGSRGKGLRAITHAAVSIALMEFCKDHDLQHPGFTIIDSPLLAYWEPEGIEDDLQGTDLKDKFYEYLISEHSNDQIIIIENEHPPKDYIGKITLTVFTKNHHEGRYGFFPIE
jgi:energy-coupling factor transporter ATP-binding protein EcfA2